MCGVIMNVTNISLDPNIKHKLGSIHGVQPKWFVDDWIIKKDLCGCEGYVETLVSTFFEAAKIALPFVKYETVFVENVYTGDYLGGGCRCKTYNPYNYVDFDLRQLINNSKYTLEQVITQTGQARWNMFCDILPTEILYKLLYIMQLDTIILNDDRHFMNVRFLQDSNGICIMAPLFDHGASLFSDECLYPYKRMGHEYCRKKWCNRLLDINYTETLKFFKCNNVAPILLDGFTVYNTINNFYIKDYNTVVNTRFKAILFTQLNELEGFVWQQG